MSVSNDDRGGLPGVSTITGKCLCESGHLKKDGKKK